MPKKKTTTIVQERVGIRLSSHEKLCAERMEHIKASIERLDKKVSQLSESVNKGRGAVAVLVFLGTIVAGVFGYLNIK